MLGYRSLSRRHDHSWAWGMVLYATNDPFRVQGGASRSYLEAVSSLVVAEARPRIDDRFEAPWLNLQVSWVAYLLRRESFQTLFIHTPFKDTASSVRQ
jgi:hypothetical protein